MEPVLVLGSHSPGLGVIRALAGTGIPVIAIYHDDKDHGYVSKYAQERIRAPHPEHSEDEFIGLLLDHAARFEGSLLAPTSDATLAAISRHKSLLERHYVVACTDWKITKLYLEKKYTYELAEEAGVPAPRTTVPKSMEDVERYAQTATYPCLVKPCQGHQYFEAFRRKMVKVENLDQMAYAYQEAADAGFEVMLQEFIPGSEGTNYNSYSWDGKPLVEFTAEKIRSAPRETGSPCVVLSEHVPEVLEPGRKILQAMGFYGYSCTEFKRDPRDGVSKLMEVNGRHNLSGLLAVRCGINFPLIQYEHLVRGNLPARCDYQTGTYWVDILRDISCSRQYFTGERYSVKQYLEPYRRPHVFAIFDWRDPKPFAKRCVSLVKMALKRT